MIILGDCRQGMSALPSNSVDSIVTDPPYGLSKQPDIVEVLTHWLAGDDYTQTGGGFMGKSWDSFVPGPKTWEQAFRVLKPGGVAAVFAGSRTVDLMSISLRMAGFEVFDMAHWLYGSGFPKSLDIKKTLEAQKNKDTGMWEGWGTALKPCHEPVILARKPLDGTYANNILKHGVGGLNVDGCRIPKDSDDRHEYGVDGDEKSPAGNGITHGDRARVAYSPAEGGRWPGNVMHDGCLPEPMDRYFYCAKANKADREAGLADFATKPTAEVTGRGANSAGHNNPRAGARGADRANIHPTVKPTELMQWLCRLVTPPKGIVLDPFTGSGSTGRGAALEGFKFIGYELSPEYHKIATARYKEALCAVK